VSINYKVYYCPEKTNRKADTLSRESRHRSENHNPKIDLQNIQFPIEKLPAEYWKTEDQPRLIKVLSLKQTEFKDSFK
jgi:hypothetical protein